jgi:hypothetical protein
MSRRARRNPSDKKHTKEVSTVRLYLKPRHAPTVVRVPLFRAKPVMVTVGKTIFSMRQPQKHQSSIRRKFLIKIQLTNTAPSAREHDRTSVGKRVAIFSRLPIRSDGSPPHAYPANQRWSAYIYTDASRDEAERMVNGLNNVIAKAKKKNKFFESRISSIKSSLESQPDQGRIGVDIFNGISRLEIQAIVK